MDTKEILIEAIKKSECVISYDDKWRYPHQDDTQKTCPLLDFMFKVEYRSGYLIFVPYKESI